MRNPKVKNLWHPCSQMKDYEDFPPIEIVKAEKEYLFLENGKKLIDAISSWWCKSLGHAHPEIKKAVSDQMEMFEHVILANTSNSLIRKLSEKLVSFTPGLDKVFYGGDGSTAVEIAVKMALHANVIKGCPDKNQFMALKNGYHGETILTLALSDLGLYKDPYRGLMQEIQYIEVPYVTTVKDPLWSDCSKMWSKIEHSLDAVADKLCGIVFEPVVQGAGGMLIYSADFLKRLRLWCNKKNVYLIADEIMTGMGRTGKALACEHAGIKPDIACLSKGLTSGWLPFSAVLTSSDMYELFYDDYETHKAFMHSNTYTGNALAAAAALATIKIYERDGIFKKVEEKFPAFFNTFKEMTSQTGVFTNIRGIGAVVAADLILPEKLKGKRAGYMVYHEAVKGGALLRPLGNTVYWMPPLNISDEALENLKEITINAVKKVFL